MLQLDPSSHYGSAWASLRLDELAELLGGGGSGGGDAAAVGISGGELWRRPGAHLGPPNQYCLDLAPKVGAAAALQRRGSACRLAWREPRAAAANARPP